MIAWLGKVNQVLKIASNFVLLHVTYILGIGVASLIGKLAGKQFLEKAPQRSSWKKHQKETNEEVMY